MLPQMTNLLERNALILIKPRVGKGSSDCRLLACLTSSMVASSTTHILCNYNMRDDIFLILCAFLAVYLYSRKIGMTSVNI